MTAARRRLHNEKRAEVAKVREQTHDAVIDASKEFAFNQRKALAEATKAAALAAKEEREEKEQAHMEKALANKAAAHESRAKAKELRDAIVTSRKAARSAHKDKRSSSAHAVSHGVGGVGGVQAPSGDYAEAVETGA